MILGRGDIATAIQDREGFTFYANGCSNRLPLTEDSIIEEKNQIDLLGEDENVGMFVYISTLSIYYSQSEYTKHKIEVEDLVRSGFDNYCIFRIGNITWGDNPNTLINYLRSNQTDIQDTYRYLIDKDELNHWIGLIPQTGKHEMNVPGKRKSVQDIAKLINQRML